MAASDYTGKEKTSLNNIKEMVANATSLEEIRANMGLGRELSTLQAANGGTGVTDLNGVADAIVDAMSQINFSQYVSDVMGTAYWNGFCERGSGNVTLASSSVVGMKSGSNRITITKSGLYEIHAKASAGVGTMILNSYSSINLYLPSNATKIVIASCDASYDESAAKMNVNDFYGKLYIPANGYLSCEYNVNSTSSSASSIVTGLVSIVRCI